MLDKTRFLARLIGLYCVLVALLMATQRDAWVAAVDALTHDAPLLLLLGVITVAAGLALVLTHNIWSGGALTVLVTVIGWLTLAKGLMFWLPPGAVAGLYIDWLHYPQLYYVYCAFALALGAWLAVGGFRTPPPGR